MFNQIIERAAGFAADFIRHRADTAAAKAAAEIEAKRAAVAKIEPVVKLPKSYRPSTDEHALAIERRNLRRLQLTMAKTTFPNALGNYPGKRTPKAPPAPRTGRDRFYALVAAFVAKRKTYRNPAILRGLVNLA